ncbi:hypothetical protein LCGC14_1204860 [marine sediment metagenome]|uniref:Uncharacterized protein n=1 Tax=marine sediment metagenome TaxID=412755 RepID=A0A0F9LK89_9ZZZZ
MTPDKSKEAAGETPKACAAAASLEDLRAWLPGAEDDFIRAQLKKGVTIVEGQNAWIAEKQKRNTAAETKKPGAKVDR